VLLVSLAGLSAIFLGFVAGFTLRSQIMVVAAPTPPPSATIRYELPADPMDLELNGQAGYLSLANGEILRVDAEGLELDLTPAAEGLPFPRGLAVTNDTVYAVFMGDAPCARGDQGCPDEIVDREIQQISTSSASVVAMDIQADGSLGEPRTLVDGLPVVNRDHSVNDLDMGPDGSLYVAVGGVDYLWDHLERLDEITASHADWLGTILRIDPESGATNIWASGFRNLYGLTFNDEGRLFAVDNDGPTVAGYRHEELLEIHEGRAYGYPFEGTFGPYTDRDDFPIYALAGVGHGGIAWSGDGVVVGSCGLLQAIPFVPGPDDSYEVQLSRLVQTVAVLPGCATSVTPLGDSLLVTLAGPAQGLMLAPQPSSP
jgi:hypothetical protein